jgi:NADH-quinone oxidoreductase subunit M
MYQRVFYGAVSNPANNSLRDLDARERVSLWPLAIAALVMGVAPMLWLHSIDPAVVAVLKQFSSVIQAGATHATHAPGSLLHADFARSGMQALLQVIGR